MLNYMRAEFYKVFHRKYLYGCMVALLACAGAIVAGWTFTNANGNVVDFYTGGTMAVMLLSLGLYMAVLIGDMVFSDQYKHNTLKNEVSYGIPRARVYLGKLAVEAILGVVMAVLVVAFYEVLCWFLLIPSDPEQARTAWMILGYCLLNALPQWLGMMAVTNLFYFLIRSNVAATFAVLGVIIVPQMVFNLLQAFTFFNAGAYYVFSLLEGWMPQAMVEGAPNVVGDWGYVVQSWILGLAWIAVSTVIGLAAFRKKEIN